VALLLALNALVLPYRGLFHDSRLYAAQVSERVAPGSLGGDLYLAYGSQDSYSAFTRLLAPLVATFGLKPTFFVVYLAGKALFFFALARFVFALVPERLAALLSLAYLAIAPLPWGGNEIFHLNEPFTTPRVPACAMVLLALERALARRWGWALALLVPAFALHPLMAFGGALVLILAVLFARLSARWLLGLGVAAALLGAVGLLYEPVGRRFLGHLDDDWRSVILGVCFFIDPRHWSAGDWLRIGCATGVTLWAARTFARERAGLLVALVVAGGLGVLGNAVAVRAPYLLLYQTSPYRTVWLLELLAAPLAFWGAAGLWRQGGAARASAAVLVLLVTADWNRGVFPPAVAFAFLLPLAVIFHRGLGAAPREAGWGRASVATAFAGTVAVLLVCNVAVLFVLFTMPARFDIDVHPVVVLQGTGGQLFKLPLVAVLLAGAAALVVRVGAGPRFALAALGLALGYQALLTGVGESREYAARFSARERHERFVTDFLQERTAERGRPLTVYWTADISDIWFKAGAHSYLNPVQLSGCAFNRGTALEGRRRAWLVRAFEADVLRRYPQPEDWWQHTLERFYRAEGTGAPDEHDLLELCRERGLDFVVVENRFAGLYEATDGRFYIYDCRQVQARAQALAGGPRR
jgi:hypothetical protein